MYGKLFWEMHQRRLFHFNGNDYIKQSSRTARMLSNGRVFYFKETDVVYPIAY